MNETTGKSQFQEIDLIHLANALLKRWWLIVMAALICGIGAYLYTRMFITPTYTSSFDAYIDSNDYRSETDRVTVGEISAARSMVSTYSAMISSKPVIDAAIKEAGLDYGYWGIASSVSVSQVNNTEIIRVSVVSADPQEAYLIAHALETAAADYMSQLIRGSSMSVLVPATYPGGMSSPSYRRNTLRGVLAGGLVMAAILIVLELLDTRVKNTEELEKRYGVVVMGTIHDLTVPTKQGYGYQPYGDEKGGSR